MNDLPLYLTINDVSMVPKRGIVRSRKNDVKMHPFIYSAPMDTVTGHQMTAAMVAEHEFPVISRFLNKLERLDAISNYGYLENVFVAVGLDEDIEPLWKTTKGWGPINIAIDVAHGDMVATHRYAEALRGLRYVRNIMSGSICTASAALRASDAGCTHLRVGIGPGAACTTRLMTGVGLPSFTAIRNISNILDNYKEIQIIADGGIKHPGDAAKYLGAGAHGVMLGSALSKTLESAGWREVDDVYIQARRLVAPGSQPIAALVKSYRGQASSEFQAEVLNQVGSCPEGASSPEYAWDSKTTVETEISRFRGGIASSISYLGINRLSDLNPDNVDFVRITNAGYQEGTPHGV